MADMKLRANLALNQEEAPKQDAIRTLEQSMAQGRSLSLSR